MKTCSLIRAAAFSLLLTPVGRLDAQEAEPFFVGIGPQNSGSAAGDIRFAPVAPADAEAMQEDLRIMARVIEKHLGRAVALPTRPIRMGIPIFLQGQTPPIGATYLDGFGALFSVKVGIPLVPPSAPPKAPTPAAEEESEWEKARREVANQRRPAPGWTPSPAPPAKAAAYDAGQVSLLTTQITEALRQAANMRHLAPDDYVAVIVEGTDPDGPKVGGMGTGFGGGFSSRVGIGFGTEWQAQASGDGGAGESLSGETKGGGQSLSPGRLIGGDTSAFEVIQSGPSTRAFVRWSGGGPSRKSMLCIRMKKAALDDLARTPGAGAPAPEVHAYLTAAPATDPMESF